MRKELALLLSFMLLCYCFAPLVRAEEAAAPQTSSTTTATPAPKSTTKPAATKPAASSSSVTADTYLADQLSDLKSLSKDDKKKISALLKMGAIEKSSGDTFGVDDTINRAQLAKTATLVLGLTMDNMAKGSSFTDVQTNDASRIYIEALKKANLTYDVVDNKFNPTAVVTRQELAMLLIKGLGLDDKAKAAAPSKDETVDANYKSYVTYALQQKLMTNQTGGKFGGNVNVTRKTLALAAYAALQLHLTTAKPAKASIAEVKVIGKNKLTVRLNREVDSNKAVLNVTKMGYLDSDNKPVKFEPITSWSDDSTIATLEMSDDLEFAQYQVILSGVDVENGTMGFIAENERAAKFEFVTNTEKLPWSKALITYKALNQYGETMKLSASNVNVYVSAPKKVQSTILADSNAIILDLSDLRPDDAITVNVLEKSGYLNVIKTFTIGDMPQVKKVDLGDPKNNLKLPVGQLVFQAGGRAYLTFKAYDQYGNRIVDSKILNMGIFKSFTGALGNVFKTDDPNDFVDFDNDGYPELQLVVYSDLDSNKEVTLNLMFNGEQISQTLNVAAPKTAYSVVIGPVLTPLTEGDKDKAISLKIIDSSNQELTSTEIAALETAGKISVYATGGLVVEASPKTRTDPKTNITRNVGIDLNGTIHVKQVTSAGPATIYVRVNGLDQTFSLPMMIEPARKPNSIKLDEGNSARTILLINSLSQAKTSGLFKIYDQFDQVYSTKRDDYKVEMKLEKLSGVTGAVYTTGAVTLTDATPVVLREITDIVKASGGDGQSITFKPDPVKKGSYKLTATLVHLDGSGQIQERLSNDSIIVDVDDINNPNLTYSLDLGSSSELLAVGRILYDAAKINSVTNATYLFSNYSSLARGVTILTKDSAGLDTGLSVKVRAVTSDNPKAMAYNNGKIIGLDSGKFNLTVFFDTPSGVKSLTQSLGSGIDSMAPTSIKISGSNPKTISNGAKLQLNGLYLWDTQLMNQLQAATNYGTFTNVCKDKDNKATTCAAAVTNQDQIGPANDFIGLQSFIGDIIYKELDPAKQDSVSVNPNFTLSYTRNPKSSDPTTNNIQQFNIYLVGGTQILKFTVILGS
ncbi:S-layer homology domain-containing protein [Paenibacillus chondroitinus]|uniref:S-layer homology domain-containing protein n=1 Tax=Paenibacillus chondroitinus TaxID=59842 RepID=A0ABU6D9G4_9BACL|nr:MULTISPECIES: S-layer homology domain-containing protein [Paenibacillus]MCY9656731.1 S-layer homology domain-containing protein [Paenibacillus anseongense]MEB4794380.1 S-layer homology domain-containing protein [Paenibacillus chondroitinus]